MNTPYIDTTIPVLGFAAFSGTGNTTLLESLIGLLSESGIRAGLLKQSHHDFEIDIPGKDSYRLRKAGAVQTLISSPYRWALINENNQEPQPSGQADLQNTLKQFDADSLDLILVEGYKRAAIPKIELHRKELDKPLLYPEDPCIIAIAHDQQTDSAHTIQELDINSPQEIADFIREKFL